MAETHGSKEKLTELQNVAIIGDLDPLKVGSLGEFYRYDYNHRVYLIGKLISKFPARGKALDLGCGRGHFASMFRELGFNECHGVDISPERAAIARDRGFSMVSLSRGQFLPFKDEYFDFVLCHAVLVHIVQPEDRADLVAEIARVTKPGGVFVLSFPSVAGLRLSEFANLITLVRPIKWLKDKLAPPPVKKADPAQYCRFYTPGYIETLLLDSGFQPQQSLGHLYLWPEILSRIVPVLKFLDSLFSERIPNLAKNIYLGAVKK